MTTITIPLKKGRVALFFSISLVFTCILITLLFYEQTPMVMKFMYTLGAAFFAMGIWYGGSLLLRRGPGLIMNDDGIISFQLPHTTIQWKNIASMEVCRTRQSNSPRIIVFSSIQLWITVKDLSKVYSKKGIRSLGWKLHAKMSMAPLVMISADMLRCTEEELRNIVRQQCKEHGIEYIGR